MINDLPELHDKNTVRLASSLHIANHGQKYHTGSVGSQSNNWLRYCSTWINVRHIKFLRGKFASIYSTSGHPITWKEMFICSLHRFNERIWIYHRRSLGLEFAGIGYGTHPRGYCQVNEHDCRFWLWFDRARPMPFYHKPGKWGKCEWRPCLLHRTD